MGEHKAWVVTSADSGAANLLFDELDAGGWQKVGAYRLFKEALAQHRHEAQAELVEALRLFIEMGDGDDARLDENGEEIEPFENARALLSRIEGSENQ